jgi:hypothetical protein
VYKPSDFLSDRQKRRGAGLAALSLAAIVAVTGIVLQWPRGATASVAAIGGDDRVALRPVPKAPAANVRAPSAYQLRCWQNGRLLFEEGPVTLGVEAREGARMVATDRHGGSVIVTTDYGGTTCLARPAPPPPSLWLPH